MKSLLTKTVFAGAVGVMLASGALAGPADDAIKGRQGCMKANGAFMGAVVPMIKGEQPFDAAAVKAAAAIHDAACADWAKWWGADAQMGETLKTRAKPEIWTNAAGFEKAGGDYYNAYVALIAATDEASFKAAFPAVGGGCKNCHDQFRAPEQ